MGSGNVLRTVPLHDLGHLVFEPQLQFFQAVLFDFILSQSREASPRSPVSASHSQRALRPDDETPRLWPSGALSVRLDFSPSRSLLVVADCVSD
jgi:hypothetical protein